jgi:hypothetical protein
MRKKFNLFSRQLLLLWARLRYPRMREDLRRMVRDNWYARMLQAKYLLKDYLLKKPYKEIHFRGEFQQELLFVLPFAYWHHKNGTLRKTVSCRHTEALYFFSPKHEAAYNRRSVKATFEAFHIPNLSHSNHYSFHKWLPVPLKAQYANSIFVYEKPLLIIANKYNREWNQPPINYLDIATLQQIITACSHQYQIIYNRPKPQDIVEDNSEILDLGEHEWLHTHHPEVLLMDDLFAQHRHKVKSFNHLQLMVYANCSHFVSVHGGTAALASYFGGTNIILSNPTWAREYPMKEWKTIFPKLSGATIIMAHDGAAAVQHVHDYLLAPAHSKAVPA